MFRLKTIRSSDRGSLGRALFIAAAGLFAPPFAHAHFILVAPDSWMSQDSFGNPQKLGPCGDEGGGTPSGRVTPFHPGETISVTINEVITHPGHYRVALAVNDRSELPADPLVTPVTGDPCGSAAIQSPPVFPILADNVLPHVQAFAGPQTFAVTLPSDITCTKCTLQVLEFMSSHGAPCFYHHCADISIQNEVVVCGDGEIQTGEQCDDGNTLSNDGCDSQCSLECGTIAQSRLTLGRLDTSPGDDTLSFQGMLTLPSPVSPMLDPLTNGIRLVIDGLAGTELDLALPPGSSGWSVNGARTRWAYRNTSAAPPAGIQKMVIYDKSTVTPGLVRYVVRGKAQSAEISATDLPLTARMIISPTGRQCGDASFASCTFNPSGNKLKCQ